MQSEDASILFSSDLAGSVPAERRSPQDPVVEGPLSSHLDALERRIVADALRSARSIRQAAIRLGVSHTTLRNKIRKHRL